MILLILDISFNQLIEDEFLSLMIRRFAFSYYVLRQHKAFKVSALLEENVQKRHVFLFVFLF